ncbi:MAG: efflux RND transporter periplasmic adaptor subunit [Thermodesulfobacteriota bacterium]
MEIKKVKHSPHPVRHVLFRIVICVAILLIGVAAMARLSKLKKPPAEAVRIEKPMRVEGLVAEPEDVDVFIYGYGEVQALDVVNIAPEVSGRVVHVHPELEVGGIIPKGKILFKIDDRNYRATYADARATVVQFKASVERLEKQYQIDKQRQLTIERNRELSRAEYERVKKLFTKNKVGTQSGVDQAEQAYNGAADAADQMARQIALYPIQIKETESGLASARARLTLAEINLKRCKVAAPFDGRVKSAGMEMDQFVSPGQVVLTLADDSVMEIHVPIDSRDAQKWLIFEPRNNDQKGAWFAGLKTLPCKIRWTEHPEENTWEGQLHRVVTFKQQTRTLTVAVRIHAETAASQDQTALPLVDGMFCSVKIPGKKLQNVIRLPRWAVTFDNTVYIANDENRLKTVPVVVARSEGDNIYISEGLTRGDRVIATRLIDPLENTLLEVDLKEPSF